MPLTNLVDLNGANIMLGVFIEPHARRQRIHMTSNEIHLVCPSSTHVDVGMTLEVTASPLVVIDNDVVEALMAWQITKLGYERELELVYMKHTNKVHGLKTSLRI